MMMRRVSERSQRMTMMNAAGLPSSPPRLYADTSVYGGVFDQEFELQSRMLFDQVRQGRFHLVISPVVERELVDAPPAVRAYFDLLRPEMKPVSISPEALDLQQAYLEAGIVSDRSAEDALHVAVATTSRCTILVSWNFRHIVHVGKGPKYNAVNTLRGWPAVAIHSPAEVVQYEEGL